MWGHTERMLQALFHYGVDVLPVGQLYINPIVKLHQQLNCLAVYQTTRAGARHEV